MFFAVLSVGFLKTTKVLECFSGDVFKILVICLLGLIEK